MANQATLTITVKYARGSSTITYRTKGRAPGLITNGLGNVLPGQPVQPTSSQAAFWQSVVTAVETDMGIT